MNCNFTTKKQNKIKSPRLLLTMALVICLSLLTGKGWAQETKTATVSSTNHSWRPSTDKCYRITKIECWGGGGAGSSKNNGGAGGGGGAYAGGNVDILNGTLDITVGTGGVGGKNTNGGNGGTSSISGGGATVTANGGKSGGNGRSGGTGSTSGVTNAVTHSGGNGGTGYDGLTYVSTYAGGGGTGAGRTQDGRNGDNAAWNGNGSITNGVSSNPGTGNGKGYGGANYNNGAGSGQEYGGGGGGTCANGRGEYGESGNGGNGVAIITYVEYPNPTVSITAVPATICKGNSSTLTASGTNINSYSWDNGLGSGNEHTVNPNVTTTYKVTVTSQYGCTATASKTVTVNDPNAGTPSISGTTTICAGSSTTLTASTTGSTGTLSYAWSTGTTTASSGTITTAGTYTVIVTATVGSCTKTATKSVTVTVNDPNAGTPSISGTTTICAGSSTTLTASTSGSTGDLTYAWSPITGLNTTTGASVTANPTETTTYTVTVTATIGSCTATDVASAAVSIYSTFSAGAIATTGQQRCYGDGSNSQIGSTTAATGGDGSISYQWQLNGADIAGATSANYTPTVTAPGTYTFTRKAKDGSCADWTASTGSYTLTIYALPTLDEPSNRTQTVCAGNAIEDITFTYTNATTIQVSGLPAGLSLSGNKITGTPTASGTYTVTTVNENGCTNASAQGTITINDPQITLNDLEGKTICDGSSTTLTASVASSNGTVTYAWSDDLGTNATSGSITSSGTYSVTATATIGSCTKTDSKSAEVSIYPTFSAGAIATTGQQRCYGDGSNSQIGSTTAATGGDGSISYQWQLNGADIAGATSATYTPTVTAPGTYTFTRKAKDGSCADWTASTGSYTLKVNAHPVFTVTPDAVLCNGGTTGKLNVKVTDGAAGFKIYKDDVLKGSLADYGTFTIENLAAGTYNNIMVEDANGCQTTINDIVITEPTELTITSLTSTPESCTGNDGTATVVATGGNGSYTYAWSNSSATAATAEGLTSLGTNHGVYTVTVTDGNDCTVSHDVTVTLDNLLAMDPITGPARCTGTEFSITPENGTNGVIPEGTKYSWPAPTAAGVTGMAASTGYESSIHGVLNNNTSNPIQVTYSVTPKVGVCVGNAVGVTVTVTTTVNPEVTITMPNTMTQCANAADFPINATFVNSNSAATAVWKLGSETVATHTLSAGTHTDSYTVNLPDDVCKGTYNYHVYYTDESGCTADDGCVITVNAGEWSIDNTTYPNGSANVECVSAATDPSASAPTGDEITDGCGRATTRTLHSTVSTPDPIVCSGTVAYTYRYTACDETYQDWTYTYTIDRTTPPAEVGGPVSTSSTVECESAATASTTLPVVKDVCGNTLTAPAPVVGGTYTDCEGTKTYTYTYKDCANLEYVWTYTYTIDRTTPPAEVGGPVSTSSTVECESAATAPTTLPVVKDVCGNTLTAPAPVVGGTYTDCEGTKTYTYTYKDCANLEYVWTYTYTIERTTIPVINTIGFESSSTVTCADLAIEPAATAVPSASDVCGTTLTGTLVSTTDNPTDNTCKFDRVYKYEYVDCAGLKNYWSYTYHVNDNVKPTFTAPADLTLYKDASCNYSADTNVTHSVPTNVEDNCSDRAHLTVSYTDADATPADACQGKKVIKRTWKVTDDCGNVSATQDQTITVEDTTRPVIATTNIDRELTSTNCTFLVPDLTAEVKAMSTDNCSDAAHLTATQDVAAGTTMLPGETKTVTVTVTDDCGNKNTKAVEITTPSQLTVAVDPATDVICYYGSTDLEAMPAGGRAAYGYAWSTSENTKTITVAPTATTTYNVTVTDANGCTATASSTVTVKPVALGMDNNTPYIRCNGNAFSVTPTGTLIPAGTQYVWTVDANANVTGQSAQSTPVDAPISQNLTNNSTTKQTVVYHVTPVTDGCSGDAFTITVDVEPTPDLTLTCPADVNRTLNFGECAMEIDPSEIGIPTWTHSLGWTLTPVPHNMPADNIYPEGDNVITWTITDECGNTATCEQHVIITFPTCPNATDHDGNEYVGVRVGCNCWTQRNLVSDTYSDGTAIPGIYDYYSDMYPNVGDNVSTFGHLYDWASVIKDGADNGYGHVQGICPDGWYLPTTEDFELLNSFGADALKSPNYWLDGGGSNSTGFTSLPAGYYDGSIDRYMNLMGEAYYWSTSKVDDHWTPVPCNIHYTCNAIINGTSESGFGYSVRCVKEKE